MSHSPREVAPEAGQGPDLYGRGWLAVNRLIRQGWSWSGHERNTVLWNRGPGMPFNDVSPISGFDATDDGRALARIDWDLDGDLDLILTARTGPRLRILENRQDSDRGWIAFLLQGEGPNGDAIGARVRLSHTESSVPAVSGVRAGEGYLAQSSSWVHFGLGASTPTSVEVRWPDGRTERFEGLQPNQRFVLRQGTASAEPWSAPPEWEAPWTSADEPASSSTGPGSEAGTEIVVVAPIPMPTIDVVDPNGSRSALFGIHPGQSSGSGFPVLFSFFSRTCMTCATELASFERARPSWSEAGLTVIPLAVDSPDEHPDVAGFLERTGWSSLWGYATPTTIETVDALLGAIRDSEERVGLPANLLVDADGRLCAFWLGPVDPKELTDRLLGLLDADPQRRRGRAVPFRGRWRNDPPGPDWGYLERFARKRGLAGAAREYHLGPLDVRPTSRAEVEYRFGRIFAEQGDYAQAIPHFEAALAADPYFFGAQRDLGLALHLTGEFGQAIEAYDAALLIAPTHEDTLYDRGLAQAGLDLRDDARRSARRLAGLNPERGAELDGRLTAIFAERDAAEEPR